MKSVTIQLGGPDGNPSRIEVAIEGCACRTEDFLMALVAFANNWKQEADSGAAYRSALNTALQEIDGGNRAPDSPCGCKGGDGA